MRIRRSVRLGCTAALPLLVPGLAAQTGGPGLSGGNPHLAPPPGKPVFEAQCSGCHAERPVDMGGRQIPTIATLRSYPPERIYDALTVGKMQAQGAALPDRQKRDVASWLGGRQLVDAAGTDIRAMHAGVCAAPRPLRADAARWDGWGNGAGNARLQSARDAGLAAAGVPRLKLKWAFGIPAAANAYSQPAVAWGRVFFGSDNAAVYALDGESGCAYWSFHADAGVRSAPIPATIGTGPAARQALLFTSVTGTAYAVDAERGSLIWKAAPPAGNTHSTGSPTYHDGRLFIPYTGTETVIGSRADYACCTSRGSVAALDATSGKLLWRSETVVEKLARIGTNAAGKALWGPSGASVWNAPTIDAKRGLLYVGTGNSFGPVASGTSDSIVAFRLTTGEMVWHHQEFGGDAFMLGCGRTNAAGGNCPAKLGPDWDFGGSSVILRTLPDGRDVLVAAGKGGIAIGLDPAHRGALLWRTPLFTGAPPTADGLVVFGGAADATNVYYPLQRPGGGLTALDLATGRPLWTARIDADPRGQVGPASAMPGMVFTGGWDGVLRAIDTTGRLAWRFDTRRAFHTVNGVEARGGSLGSGGPVVAGGLLIVPSGYVGMQQGSAGNVILAFGL